MTFIAETLADITMTRTSEADTLLVQVSFYTDPAQFRNSQEVRQAMEAAGCLHAERDDIHVGGASFAATFLPRTEVEKLGDAATLSMVTDRLNDTMHFSPRACGIANYMLPLMHRVGAPLEGKLVTGLVVLDELSCAPGFNSSDLLAGALEQLQVLTAAAADGLLFLSSEQDRHDSVTAIHRAMADQLRFARAHPTFGLTTFPRIAPLAGTIAGIIPAKGSWGAEGDWQQIGTSFEPDPEWNADS